MAVVNTVVPLMLISLGNLCKGSMRHALLIAISGNVKTFPNLFLALVSAFMWFTVTQYASGIHTLMQICNATNLFLDSFNDLSL